VYRELGHYGKAIEAYTESIESITNPILSYTARGEARIMAGDYAGAMEDFNSAIQREPNARTRPTQQAYARRCRLKWAMGDYRNAIEDCTTALNGGSPKLIFVGGWARAGLIDPSWSSYLVRGWAKEKLGDSKGAMEDYAQAIKINPNGVQGYFNHGLLREQAGDYRAALDDYTQAIARCSSEDRDRGHCAPYYFHRAKVKEKHGDRQGAQADYLAAKYQAVREWQPGWGIETQPQLATKAPQAAKNAVR
jgi:tetratricopeptide (TPR) repeat protein